MKHNKRRVVALGFFDGVHLGHGALLRLAAQRARDLNAVAAALTFDAHPDTLVSGQAVPLINSPADRAGLMERLYGIEDIIVAHFDGAMMKMPWDSFVTDYLVGQYDAVHLVAGHDFRFGHRGAGTPALLKELCDQLGVGCDIVEKVELDGRTVSSTLIRSLITEGDMERAAAFLGHTHVLTGPVEHGKKLGGTIGIPTVNLTIPAGVLAPAYGVYATLVHLPDGRTVRGVTNVGVRPTLDDGGHVTVEGFLLDFEGDLYGQVIRVEFFKRLRGERRFGGLEELRDEILRNAEQTREYFGHIE